MEVSMSDVYQDGNNLSTYDNEPERSLVQGTLEGWVHLANCKGFAKLFFGKSAERPQARVRRESKAHSLCSSCAVKPNCRSFARNNHEYGFWGDENEESRHEAGFTLSSPIGVHITPIILE
jgi:WhiB family redox-sensing transcriptional regulator